MELDVHLKRKGEESWGFRLIGGKEYAMPITVAKVVADSPASAADLCTGDVVCRINQADTCAMSHEDAKRCVAEATDLTLGVKRGLYDPVLDDYEPIYEDIDQGDFDQPSQPTEVDPFKLQQFLDPSGTPGEHQFYDPRKSSGLPELRDIEIPLPCTQNGTDLDLDQSRSLTASPFVLPTKSYRPFSTEPLPDVLVPPLESPIILNPNYKDNFSKLDEGDVFPATRFKLPISEQYDPDGKKKKEGSAVKEVNEENVIKEVKFAEEQTKKSKKDVSASILKYAKGLKQKQEEEKTFVEKMKQEIDLDKIEKTAVSVVDESIERAVSVTDEIKKEIDMELCKPSREEESKIESSKISSEITTSESIKKTAEATKITNEKVSKDANKLVDLIDQTTEDIITYNDQKAEVKVAKEVRKFESHDVKEQVIDERKLSTKQEIEETIEVGSVRRKSEVFDKKTEVTEKVDKKAKQTKKDVKEAVKTEHAEDKLATQKDVKTKASKTDTNETNHKTSEINKDSVSTQKTNVKSSTATRSKLSDHTTAYLIGLQTIPNIKGTITSQHYHLLLKTFFIHLTDVMVALSRFILTEPAFSKTGEKQEIRMEESVSEYEKSAASEKQFIETKQEMAGRKQSIVKENNAVKCKKEEAIEIEQESIKAEKVAVQEKVVDFKQVKSNVEAQVTYNEVDQDKSLAQKVVVEAIEDKRYRDETQENFEVEQIMERKEKRSGAEMAQLQERKSAELTQKMEAVITEFQNKAGIEELETTKERRSRSRSNVGEGFKEEMEVTETKTESTAFTSLTESTEKKRVETLEIQEKSSKSEEGKQMYVAIVESHVFTNKDAIFEAVNFTETSSVVRAEETNLALQASETVATEEVSMENREIKKEIAESVLEESRELNIVNAQSVAVVENANEIQTSAFVEETEAIIEEVKEEKAVEVKTKVEQEVAIQEVIEPIVEIQEMRTVDVSEDYQKLSIKEEEHVMSVSEKTEVSLAETHESFSIAKEEYAAVSMEESKATKTVKEETHVAITEIKQEEFAAVSTEETKVKEIKAVEIKEEELKTVEIVREEIKQEIEAAEIKEASKAVELVKQEVKKVEYVPPPIQEVNVEFRVVQKPKTAYQEESVALTIVKPAKTPTDEKQEMSFLEQTDVSISKTAVLGSDSEFSEVSSKIESTQESSFTAKLSQESIVSLAEQKRSLKLDLNRRQSDSDSVPSTINTPTPATVPPTPLIDNYVFKLKAKMPKEDGTPIPRDCTPTPEDEDPQIVKKKLIPYIETTLESPVIYDPPLPSPPMDKVQSPTYTKPGLKGGCDRLFFRKEEILEIERKSSLLASAIDETIKSIEEYKEEVGIDTKKEIKVEDTTTFRKSTSKTANEHTISNSEGTIETSSETQPIIYNGYAKVETRVYNNIENSRIDDDWNKIDKLVKESNEELTELSNNIDVEVDVTLKVKNDIKSEVNSIDSGQISNKSVEVKAGIDRENNLLIEPVHTTADKEKPASVDVALTELRKEKNADVTAEFTIRKDSITSVKEKDETSKIASHKESFEEVIKTDMEETKGVKFNGISEICTKEVKSNGISDGICPKTMNLYHESEVIEINGTIDSGLTNGKLEMTNGVPKAVIEKAPAMFATEDKKDPMAGYRPIQFDPEEIMATRRGLQSIHLSVQHPIQRAQSPSYVDSKGELLGSKRGIVDGLEKAVVDEEIAKELGKPGMTEEKIAELISGESELLREAHVMGLSRVLKSHMHRDDDSSVDFKKIKPILDSLRDSEVLKALNDEIERAREEKRREEEKKWTTFLQKPKRKAPKAKFGYHGWVEEQESIEQPYKVKIVKQPKPKVAPDYKPENFETGPLPWEERALNEPPAPPVEAEDPILIPEESPEFLEAVDPLPESEVPDLEDTGIRLPSPPVEEESSPSPAPVEQEQEVEEEELEAEEVVEESDQIVEMEQNRLAEQLLMGVQSMVDPNASVEQQLAQMRAQMAALAQLPSVIQQTLDVVTKQLSQLSRTEVTSQMTPYVPSESVEINSESHENIEEVTQNRCEITEVTNQESEQETTNAEDMTPTVVEIETKPSLTQEEMEKLKKEEEEMIEEQRRVEKQKKELMDQMKLEQESRQVKNRSAPRVGKPKQVFGPPQPVARPLVLPGGRRWRKPEDAYNDAFFTETLAAQAELIQGKTKGINFMKYEKPPVSLDHLQHSETYKLIHNMELAPSKRVDMLTPVIAECDYREKCRSVTPTSMIP